MRLWFQGTAVFWVFGLVSAQLQGFQTCAFAKASPKTKNPRCPSLYLFCQCSKFTGFHYGIDNIFLISVGLNVLIKRVSPAVRKIPYSNFPAPVYLVY